MENNKTVELKVSDQFLGVLMVLLQKSLMQQTDIVPELKSLKLNREGNEIYVLNPPLSINSED